VRLTRIRDLLAATPPFAAFDARSLDDLAGCARNDFFAPGEIIFREDEALDRLWVIRHGDVAVEISVPGRAPVAVETLHQGDVLGWAWLTEESRAMSDARALSAVRAIRLDAACLRAKCEARPEIGWQMLKHWLPHLAARVRSQRLQLLDLYAHDPD
jgi:CRP-like cAMP-binding protein